MAESNDAQETNPEEGNEVPDIEEIDVKVSNF